MILFTVLFWTLFLMYFPQSLLCRLLSFHTQPTLPQPLSLTVFSHHAPALWDPQVCYLWTFLSPFPVSPFLFSSIWSIFLGQCPCWITFFFIFSPLPFMSVALAFTSLYFLLLFLSASLILVSAFSLYLSTFLTSSSPLFFQLLLLVSSQLSFTTPLPDFLL